MAICPCVSSDTLEFYAFQVTDRDSQRVARIGRPDRITNGGWLPSFPNYPDPVSLKEEDISTNDREEKDGDNMNDAPEVSKGREAEHLHHDLASVSLQKPPAIGKLIHVRTFHQANC